MKIYKSNLEEYLYNLFDAKLNYRITNYGDICLIGKKEEREVLCIDILARNQPIIEIEFDSFGDIKNIRHYTNIYKLHYRIQVKLLNKLLGNRYKLTRTMEKQYLEAVKLYKETGEIS